MGKVLRLVFVFNTREWMQRKNYYRRRFFLPKRGKIDNEENRMFGSIETEIYDVNRKTAMTLKFKNRMKFWTGNREWIERRGQRKSIWKRNWISQPNCRLKQWRTGYWFWCCAGRSIESVARNILSRNEESSSK